MYTKGLSSGTGVGYSLSYIHLKKKYTHNMYALLYLKDIDAEKKQQEAAQMDPLTGVYNRKAFEDKVMQHMSDHRIGCQGAVVLLDVDNFKSVNDQYGHLAGG